MISFLCVYYLPPSAAKGVKGIFRGHPEPRQRTLSSALLFCLLPSTAKEKGDFLGSAVASLDARPRTLAKDVVLCTPVFHNHYAALFSLCFFECAGDFAEGEFVSVVDWCCFIWLQALAVDACGVCAIQVGDCVGAADMLDGSMDA